MPIVNSGNASHEQTGFTLVEILLTITLVVVITGFSLPFFRETLLKNDLDTSALIIAHSLRRAETLAIGSKYDNNWGVILEPGTVTIYSLDAIGNRITENDEPTSLPTTINFSGLTNVVFNKFSGVPVTTGTITLINEASNESKNITISETGLVEY
jgi:prepilin-type N-terminal cleavage/methylation domain-containing protein